MVQAQQMGMAVDMGLVMAMFRKVIINLADTNCLPSGQRAMGMNTTTEYGQANLVQGLR